VPTANRQCVVKETVRLSGFKSIGMQTWASISWGNEAEIFIIAVLG